MPTFLLTLEFEFVEILRGRKQSKTERRLPKHLTIAYTLTLSVYVTLPHGSQLVTNKGPTTAHLPTNIPPTCPQHQNPKVVRFSWMYLGAQEVTNKPPTNHQHPP